MNCNIYVACEAYYFDSAGYNIIGNKAAFLPKLHDLNSCRAEYLGSFL
jgi:hypothetical protein